MITINLLFIVTVLAAALSLFDGIARLRGRGGAAVLAVAEIVFAALMLVSLFVAFPEPLGLRTWAILLEIVLVILLILRGGGRRNVWIVTIIALVLNTIVILVSLGWLTIPGLF
jgi:hypothetical protein